MRKDTFQKGILVLLSAIALTDAAAVARGAKSGLHLCGTLLIPALFPFLFLSNLLLVAGALAPRGGRLSHWLARRLGISQAGVGAVLLGLLGGYPTGAYSVAALYTKGKLSKQEAQHLLRFCNNSGPAFFVGAVGLNCLGSAVAGLRLYLLHALSALLLGLAYAPQHTKFVSPTNAPQETVPAFSAAFSEAVTKSLRAMLQICALVILFSALFSLLCAHGVLQILCCVPAALGVDAALSNALLCGMLELSSGIAAVQGALPFAPAYIVCAVLCSFGGLCVYLQSAALCGAAELELRGYLTSKLLHGLLAGVLSAACLFLPRPLFLLLCLLLFPAASFLAKICRKKKTPTGISTHLPV